MNGETLYHEARKLNSDLGRHVRQCSFSTHLSGRFYQNNSMESHKARARRIKQMKSKRLSLEKSLAMEKKKIEWLESKLREKRELKRLEEERRLIMELAAVRIQAFVRTILAKYAAEVKRVEQEIRNHIAIFLQSRYRGWRDRTHVHKLRLRIAERKMEQLASIRIQTIWRGEIAKSEVQRRKKILHQTRCCATKKIQACMRGGWGRDRAKRRRRTVAAIRIQCMYRVTVARGRLKIARDQARHKRGERPKRIPLHKRRYSTYAGLPNAAGLAELGKVRLMTPSSSKGNNGRKSNSKRMTAAVNMVMAVNALRKRTARVRGLDIVRASQRESTRRRRGSGDSSTLPSTNYIKQGTVTSSNASSSQRESGKSRTESGVNSRQRVTDTLSNASSHHNLSRDEDTASTSSSTIEHTEERNRQSRHRAALRAAKLKREKELDKEQMLQNANARKEVLGKLEATRRIMMEKEIEATKKRRNKQQLSSTSTKKEITEEGNAEACDTECQPLQHSSVEHDKHQSLDENQTSTNHPSRRSTSCRHKDCNRNIEQEPNHSSVASRFSNMKMCPTPAEQSSILTASYDDLYTMDDAFEDDCRENEDDLG